MPGVATAQLLSYANVVDVAMDQSNDVNLADVEDYGHRVVIEVSKAAMDSYLGWSRAAGSARPVAALDASKEQVFKAAISEGLNGGFVDIDGVAGGLHFGTANMDTNSDARKRASGGVSVNDLPFCYMMYKLYGASSAVSLDKIYNLGDAWGMLGNGAVTTAITDSFKAQVSGSVDKMFRDLLASDPSRFFDAAGVPVPGIFETNADAAGAGSWKLTANDTLEVKLKLVFQSKVTRRGVAGREINVSALGSYPDNQQIIINPGDYFYVRLQLKAVDVAAPVIPPTFYNMIPDVNTSGVALSTAFPSNNSFVFKYTFVAPAPTLDVYVKTMSGQKYDAIERIYRTGYSTSLLDQSKKDTYLEILSVVEWAYGGLYFTRPYYADVPSYENTTNVPNFRLKNLVPGDVYIIWSFTGEFSQNLPANDPGADASISIRDGNTVVDLTYVDVGPNSYPYDFYKNNNPGVPLP
jgi:hypothetical protein